MKRLSENRWIIGLQRFFSFFLLMCMVITCSMLLFLDTMSSTIGLELDKPLIQTAAVLTFINVIFLSLVCAVIDTLRRRIMVDLPVRKITEACEKVMQGDLSVRLQPHMSLDPTDGFNIINDYFNRMIEELSGMETLRTDFIANVSHELKTPLAVIQNYGILLQQENLEEPERIEHAQAITASCQRLSAMISNILKLNKLENQNIYPNRSRVDLSGQLCECLLGFENVWERNDIEIDTRIEENVSIVADPELLSLVWNNLLSNAFKFTDPGGKVAVSLESDEENAVVKISDTGCGISPEVGKHIFEKFYQGDTSHATEGNGLGLALVKRVIDIAQGDISVVSEAGKGSTFTVTLPKSKDETM